MRYYLNKISQPNNTHEIHSATCVFLPLKKNRIDLGETSNCLDALENARKYFEKVNGCIYCAEQCHEY